MLCHTCDNPVCCRLSHLYEGEQKTNMGDMVSRNRQAKGVDNGIAKLTEDDVRAIRRRYAKGGVKQQELADEYGVSHTLVSYVVRRVLWQHV